MKKMSSLLCVLYLFLISGCGENLLAPPGTISFYGSPQGGGGSFSLNNSQVNDGITSQTLTLAAISIESRVYIKQIEISMTGEKWETVFDGSTEVDIKTGEIASIGNYVSVPSGQYHGLRLALEPKITVLKAESWFGSIISTFNVTLEEPPMSIDMQQGGNFKSVDSLESIEFTSANGMLIPFDVEGNKKTFIVFEFFLLYFGDDFNNPESWDWHPRIQARATRFLY